MAIFYICRQCSEETEIRALFDAVNEVGRKSCEFCGDNQDNPLGIISEEQITALRARLAAHESAPAQEVLRRLWGDLELCLSSEPRDDQGVYLAMRVGVRGAVPVGQIRAALSTRPAPGAGDSLRRAIIRDASHALASDGLAPEYRQALEGMLETMGAERAGNAPVSMEEVAGVLEAVKDWLVSVGADGSPLTQVDALLSRLRPAPVQAGGEVERG